MGATVEGLVNSSFSTIVSLVSQFYPLFALMVGAMLLAFIVSLWRRS